METSKHELRSKLPNVATTIFTRIGNLAREHNALDLSQGFPNFEMDPELIALTTEAMKKGFNQYAPMQGYFGLRTAIADKIQRLHGHTYDPDTEITVTVGATQAIFTAITAFVHPGDEVIVLKPAYDCYEPAIVLNGGIPIPVQLNNTDFKVDWALLKSKITAKTRMLIINTPHNPSGRVFSENDMLQLQEILKPTNIILISDEAYEHLVFDERVHWSAARFTDLASRTFVCASFGKTFHITGWKMGYCAAPKALMTAFLKIHQFAVFSIHHPVQRAMAVYLQNADRYLGLPAFYQQKRDFFLGQLDRSKFTFTPTEGTYFQLLDFSEWSNDSDEAIAERLIVAHKLACIPISSFNEGRLDHRLLRFCFAKTEETLEQAAAILNRL